MSRIDQLSGDESHTGNAAVVLVSLRQMRINRLDDIPDVSTGLSNKDEASMRQALNLNKGQKIVIKRGEHPVVFFGERQLFPIWFPEHPFVASDTNAPATTS